jgi:hypothetical protein
MSIGRPRVVHALGKEVSLFFEGEGGGNVLGDVDDSGDVALDWGAGEEEVDLVV